MISVITVYYIFRTDRTILNTNWFFTIEFENTMSSTALLKKIFMLICFVNVTVTSQDFSDTVIPRVSLISSNIFFITRITEKSNGLYDPHSKRESYVIVTRNYLVYDLKFNISLRESKIISAIPLDIRLTFSKNNSIVIHIEDDISDFVLNEIKDYDMELRIQQSGWVTFEIGEFNDTANITYDRTTMYLSY